MQHLLAAELRVTAEAKGNAVSGAPADETTPARIRPVPWERVLELQDLQSEDLLEGFLDKQRTVAAALGAEIPEIVVAFTGSSDGADPNRPRTVPFRSIFPRARVSGD